MEYHFLFSCVFFLNQPFTLLIQEFKFLFHLICRKFGGTSWMGESPLQLTPPTISVGDSNP